MSEVMQQGILRMPPECWMNGEPLDERQRYSAYVAAADRILELEDENAALREDKEILDWMNGNIEAIMFKYKPDGFVWDFRDIIRGAMAKEDKP